MTVGIEQITVNGAELGCSMLGAEPEKSPLVFTHGYAILETFDLAFGLFKMSRKELLRFRFLRSLGQLW